MRKRGPRKSKRDRRARRAARERKKEGLTPLEEQLREHTAHQIAEQNAAARRPMVKTPEGDLPDNDLRLVKHLARYQLREEFAQREALHRSMKKLREGVGDA